jgi:hypothetical protein
MTKQSPHANSNYPKNRAARVDRSKMTPEEWDEHKKKKDCEKCARWNARNPGKSNGNLRKRRGAFPWYSSLLHAGDRSRKVGHEHDLTVEWAIATYTGVCSLTGVPFVISALTPAGKCGVRPYSPSIDRINPLKGYTQDNCRWVLSAINSFKGEMSDAEMYHVALALLSRRALADR